MPASAKEALGRILFVRGPNFTYPFYLAVSLHRIKPVPQSHQKTSQIQIWLIPNNCV